MQSTRNEHSVTKHSLHSPEARALKKKDLVHGPHYHGLNSVSNLPYPVYEEFFLIAEIKWDSGIHSKNWGFQIPRIHTCDS